MFVSDASKIQIRHEISIIFKNKIKAQRPDKVRQLLNQNIEKHLCTDTTSQEKSVFNNQHNSAKIFEHGKVSQI